MIEIERDATSIGHDLIPRVDLVGDQNLVLVQDQRGKYCITVVLLFVLWLVEHV